MPKVMVQLFRTVRERGAAAGGISGKNLRVHCTLQYWYCINVERRTVPGLKRLKSCTNYPYSYRFSLISNCYYCSLSSKLVFGTVQPRRSALLDPPK